MFFKQCDVVGGTANSGDSYPDKGLCTLSIIILQHALKK